MSEVSQLTRSATTFALMAVLSLPTTACSEDALAGLPEGTIGNQRNVFHALESFKRGEGGPESVMEALRKADVNGVDVENHREEFEALLKTENPPKNDIAISQLTGPFIGSCLPIEPTNGVDSEDPQQLEKLGLAAQEALDEAEAARVDVDPLRAEFEKLPEACEQPLPETD